MNIGVSRYDRIGLCMHCQLDKGLIVSVSARGSVDCFGNIDYFGIRYIVRQKLKLFSPVQAEFRIGKDANEFPQRMRTDERNN